MPHRTIFREVLDLIADARRSAPYPDLDTLERCVSDLATTYTGDSMSFQSSHYDWPPIQSAPPILSGKFVAMPIYAADHHEPDEIVTFNPDTAPIVIFAGIDPGSKGAIVAINDHRAVILQHRLPWHTGEGLILSEFWKTLLELRNAARDAGGRLAVALERQSYRPTDGGKGTFTCGRTFGALEMGLVALGLPYEIPAPNMGVNGWHRMLQGAQGEDTKRQAMNLCRRQLPGLVLIPKGCRKPHDGLGDAGALALWCLEKFGGKG